MSIRTCLLAASIAAGAFAPLELAAQHQEHLSAPGQLQSSADSSHCAQAQLVITGTVDATMARLETARQANSPAQMRAAIDDVQGALRDVRAQLARCAATQSPADPHAGHTMPGQMLAPAGVPATPVMAPGSPMDHSKMPMGAAPVAKPAAGGKSAVPAPMDRSMMQMGSPPAAKPAKGAKAEAPAAPMDHSKMSMAKPADASAQAVDPVCGLKVDPATAPRATLQGRTYSFCSEQHRQLFQKNPAKYLPKGQ